MDSASSESTSIGLALKSLRRSRSLSISDLARSSGIDRSNISRIESGRHNPSIATLEKLATALQIEVGKLIRMGDEITTGKGELSTRLANPHVLILEDASLEDVNRHLGTLRTSLRLLSLEETLGRGRAWTLLNIAMTAVDGMSLALDALSFKETQAKHTPKS